MHDQRSLKPRKLIELFIYLGSNVSSTKNDENMHKIVERLMTRWKPDLSDK